MEFALYHRSLRILRWRISWEVKAAGAYDWQPYHLHVKFVMKSGGLNLLEPSGPLEAFTGIASLFFCTHFREICVPVSLTMLSCKLLYVFMLLFCLSLPHNVVFRLCLFCQIIGYMENRRFFQARLLMLPSVILSMCLCWPPCVVREVRFKFCDGLDMQHCLVNKKYLQNMVENLGESGRFWNRKVVLGGNLTRSDENCP